MHFHIFMSYQIITQLLFLGSSLGICIVVFRKIPVLLNLPETESEGVKENFTLKLIRKIKEINPWKNFSYEIFLQKILTKIRILSLKTDNQTSNLLQRLRTKYRQKKVEQNDNYWEKIKEEIKKPR